MVDKQVLEAAKEHFGKVLEGQLDRVENLKAEGDWTDYSAVEPIVIGVLGVTESAPPSPRKPRTYWSTCSSSRWTAARWSSAPSMG